MESDRRECTAELGSMTQAMRAQSVLGGAAIPSTVMKMKSTSHRGCVYGISFSRNQRKNVQTVLESAGIPVRKWGEGT
jgi:hypothetical protein